MRHLLTALVPAMFLAVPACARAQCVMLDPPQLFERSDVVFRGAVLSTQSTGSTGAHQIVQIATFEPGRVWKGAVPRAVSVGVDRPVEKGAEYLVFAAGTPLTTSVLCGWAIPAAKADATVTWLKQRLLGDLAAAEARWAANRPARYELAIEVRCFCGADGKPKRFRVSDETAISLQELGAIGERVYGAYDTVEKIFAFVRRSIEDGVDGIDVRYDAALGYPSVVGVDPIRRAIDDERSVRIVSLRKIE